MSSVYFPSLSFGWFFVLRLIIFYSEKKKKLWIKRKRFHSVFFYFWNLHVFFSFVSTESAQQKCFRIVNMKLKINADEEKQKKYISCCKIEIEMRRRNESHAFNSISGRIKIYIWFWPIAMTAIRMSSEQLSNRLVASQQFWDDFFLFSNWFLCIFIWAKLNWTTNLHFISTKRENKDRNKQRQLQSFALGPFQTNEIGHFVSFIYDTRSIASNEN